MKNIKSGHLLPIFSLLLILIVFYFPILFLGKTVQGPEMFRVNTNLVSPPQPYDVLSGKIAPQIFNTPQYIPAIKWANDIFMGNSYRHFKIPLWNSHIGIGTPIAAQYEMSAFFPIQIIQNLFPARFKDSFYVLDLWIAGIFAYLFFIIGIRLDKLSAFFGATLYMCSGVFTWFIQLQDYTAVAIMLPLVMLTSHFLSEREKIKNIAFLSLSTALLLYGGQPEAAFYALTLVSSYFIYKSVMKKNSALFVKDLSYFITSIILSLLIASPLILIFMQLYSHGFTMHPHDQTNFAPIVGIDNRTPFFLLAGIILPGLLNQPIMPSTLPFSYSWDYLGSYIGIVGLFFLITLFFSEKCKLKNDATFFICFSIAFMLMNMGIWPFQFIGYLPVFRQAWSPRWGGAAWGFSLVSAATYGFYLLKNSSMNQEQWKRAIKYSVIIGMIVIYLCILPTASIEKNILISSYGQVQLLYPLVVSEFNQPNTLIFVNGISSVAILYVFYLLFTRYRYNPNTWVLSLFILIISSWYNLPNGSFIFIYFTKMMSTYHNFFATNTVLLVFSLLLLATTLLLTSNQKKTFVVIFSTVITANVIFQLNTLPGYPKYTSTVKNEHYIKFLKDNSGYNRIFGFGGAMMLYHAPLYDLYDIRTASAISINTYQYFLMHYIIDQNTGLFPQIFDAFYFPNYLTTFTEKEYIAHLKKSFLKAIDLLGVKYIIVPRKYYQDAFEKTYPEIKNNLITVFLDNNVNIKENKGALPRTFLVDRLKFTNSYEKAQSIAMNDGFSLLHEAVLEKPLLYQESKKTILKSSSSIEHYSDKHIAIKVSTNKTALLILTDIDYPGWHATVDSKNAKIYRVDGLVRGVLVPSGEHVVEFDYNPNTFKRGLLIMGSSLVVCLLTFLL